MMKYLGIVSFVLLPLFLLTGCKSSSASKPYSGYYADRRTFERGEIQLPGNYNRENFRKLLMGVAVSVNVDPLSNAQLYSINPAQGFSSRLQAEMGKLKRFSIYSAFNRDGVYMYKSLEDIGEIEVVEATEMPQIDLLLNLHFTLLFEQFDDGATRGNIFSCHVTANCEELKSHTVKFSTTAKGEVVRYEKPMTSNRKTLSFNGITASSLSSSEIRAAYMTAALKAIANVVRKIGNYYPIGGRITGVLGDRMTLDRGAEQGIGQGMQMVIYTTVNGVDVPLAIAEAAPSDQTANLRVWRWNNDDPFAKTIIRQLKRNSEWISSNECFAVSLRLAVPPEWDADTAL